MASYFNLTLDTLAPAGLAISLNNDALYCTSTAVTLKTTLTDADTTSYQMKIWGIASADDPAVALEEAAASWETFEAEKAITLTTGDGLKTVHVKVRDAVGNESAEVTDDITLNSTVPVVTVTGPDKATISKVDGYNSAVVSFTTDVAFVEYKVCVVPANATLEDAGVVIPTDNGSINTSGLVDLDTDPDAELFPAATPISVTIKGADLEAASAGDGVKTVKVFVKNEAGTWSVA